MNYKELKSRIQEVELKDNVRISDCEIVVNGQKFVDSHIHIIEATEGKSKEIKRRIGLPFYRRLENYYKQISFKN